MVPLAALTVPTYLLFARAQLTDTYLAVILPSLATPFGVFLMRVYAADAVDDSLIEAGRVDGVGEIRIFFTIALPAAAARLGHRAAVRAGGELEQLLPPADHAQLPGEVPARRWVWPSGQSTATGGSGSQALFSTVITGSLLSILPLVIAFLFLQRYWQSGLAAGGVKA